MTVNIRDDLVSESTFIVTGTLPATRNLLRRVHTEVSDGPREPRLFVLRINRIAG